MEHSENLSEFFLNFGCHGNRCWQYANMSKFYIWSYWDKQYGDHPILFHISDSRFYAVDFSKMLHLCKFSTTSLYDASSFLSYFLIFHKLNLHKLNKNVKKGVFFHHVWCIVMFLWGIKHCKLVWNVLSMGVIKWSIIWRQC